MNQHHPHSLDAALIDTPSIILGQNADDVTIERALLPAADLTAETLWEARFALVNFDLPIWNSSNLHWEAPSNMTFYSDGRVYLYLRRIANHRRHGPFNQGRTYHWSTDYQSLDRNKAVIEPSTLRLAILAFKKARNHADAEKMDAFLKANWRDIGYVQVTRRIHR